MTVATTAAATPISSEVRPPRHYTPELVVPFVVSAERMCRARRRSEACRFVVIWFV